MGFRFDYFKTIENKYSSRLGTDKAICVRLDGKGVCKNKNINMISNEDGGFFDSAKKAALEVSRKLNCNIYFVSDEFNIVFEDARVALAKFGKLEAQKISTLVSQEIFSSFNENYSGETIYFDARTFSLPIEKVNCYLHHRMSLGTNAIINSCFRTDLNNKKRRNVQLSRIIEYLEKNSKEYASSTLEQREGFFVKKGELTDGNIIKLRKQDFLKNREEKTEQLYSVTERTGRVLVMDSGDATDHLLE